MVNTTAYGHRIPYLPHPLRGSFPGLVLRLANPRDPSQTVDTEAQVDSGATHSVFSGELARCIGVEVLDGEAVAIATAIGESMTVYQHDVRCAHSLLGEFALRIAFTTGPQRRSRNVLGRNFFRLAQIGFRESSASLFVTLEP